MPRLLCFPSVFVCTLPLIISSVSSEGYKRNPAVSAESEVFQQNAVFSFSHFCIFVDLGLVQGTDIEDAEPSEYY